ncbi:hypothetical protein F5Y15DRAFT_430410 [Xylariaceae sp. FL0016]|nr:hypothetical protein F5Y15DRAFT_430410 [Xylariaceae sp. FL0016]
MGNNIGKLVWRGGGSAGSDRLQLQCPFSNCYPQLYEESDKPCAVTPFKDYRHLDEHIWMYHSFLRSCKHCDVRFFEAKKSKRQRLELETAKIEHFNRHHANQSTMGNDAQNDGTLSKYHVLTMTQEQDKRFTNWQSENAKRKNLTDEEKYKSLCKCLIEDDVNLPTDIKFHYLMYEHLANPLSYERGQKNLELFKGRHQYTEQSFQMQPFPATPSSTENGAWSLDDDSGPQPLTWHVRNLTPTVDSGYGSKDKQQPDGTRDEGAPQWSRANPDPDLNSTVMGSFADEHFQYDPQFIRGTLDLDSTDDQNHWV